MVPSPANAGPGPARRLLRRFEDAVLASLLALMIFLAALQIFLRNFFDAGIGWADPTVRLLVLWVGLLGALAASRDDRQINVDVLSRLLSERTSALVRIATHLVTAAITAVISYYAAQFVLSEYEFGGTAFARVPTWATAVVIPLSMAGISIRYFWHAVDRTRALVSSEPEQS